MKIYLIAAGLLLSLAACKKSDSQTKETTTDSTQKATEKPTENLDMQFYTNEYFEYKTPTALKMEPSKTMEDLEKVRCQGCYTGLEGYTDFNNPEKTVYFAAYQDGLTFAECTVAVTSEENKTWALDSNKTAESISYSYKTFDYNKSTGEKDPKKPVIQHVKHLKTKSGGAMTLTVQFPENEKDKWTPYALESLNSFKSKK